MTGELCVDASVAIKWYVPEESRDQAVALLQECRDLGIQIVVPDHFFSEAGNGIWRAALRGAISTESGLAALSLLPGLNIETFDVRDLYTDAWRIAARFSRPTVYDAYYVALSEQRGCDLWTADERLLNAMPGISCIKNIRNFLPGTLAP